jgi:hypothetical protein
MRSAEFAELFNVDVDHLTGMGALIAAHGLRQIKRLELVQAKALENTADRSGRNAYLLGDVRSWSALAAQRLDPADGL